MLEGRSIVLLKTKIIENIEKCLHGGIGRHWVIFIRMLTIYIKWYKHMYRLSDEKILEAIESSNSMQEAANRLGIKYLGVLYRRASKLGIWKPNQEGKGISKRKKYKYKEDVFIPDGLPSTKALRFYLEKERPWKCEQCGISEWQGKELPLQIHHIDGNHRNNVESNLKILCPNCHSITDSWCKQKHLRK